METVAPDAEGVIIRDEETFGEFLQAFANIQPTQPFRVRLVSTREEGHRVAAISIGDQHWIAGPVACRLIAQVIADDVQVSAISAPGSTDLYAPDETGIVQALRDCADRLEVKRLN